MTNKYNYEAVQHGIDKDKTIGKKEAKLIHALLKGRRLKEKEINESDIKALHAIMNAESIIDMGSL
jgi:hypothetical protein